MIRKSIKTKMNPPMKATADNIIALFEGLPEEEKAKVLRHLGRLTPGYRFTADEYDRMVEQLEEGNLDKETTKKRHYVRTT